MSSQFDSLVLVVVENEQDGLEFNLTEKNHYTWQEVEWHYFVPFVSQWSSCFAGNRWRRNYRQRS